MPLRLFALLSLLGLLAACATKPPVAPQLPAEPPPTAAELALLVLDQRGLPDGLLGNIQMRGDGAPLPFRLPFNPQAFAPGARIELRGRVHLSGRLILRLLPLPIRHAQSQSLGELRLVPAP